MSAFKDKEKQDAHETFHIPDVQDEQEPFPAIPNTLSGNDINGEKVDDSTSDEEIAYPEGGLQAWLVVFGAFCGMVACAGFMNTIGVFHAYLSNNQLKDYGESTIGWIFSVFTFLAFFLGIQIGPIFDVKGPRVLVFVGSVMLTAVLFLLGFCQDYYQFMLVWGVMAGIGFSLIFTPAVSAIGHFFLKGRGNATGIAAAGGSVGGIIFPLLMQSLIPKVGFAWTTRILGFVFLGLLIPANLLIRSRPELRKSHSSSQQKQDRQQDQQQDQKQQQQQQQQRRKFSCFPRSSLQFHAVKPDLSILRDPAFALATAGTFFMEGGLFVPIAYLTSFALATEVTSTALAYQLVAIFNAGSCLGRWLPGYIADRIGRFNTMILMLALCGISTIALWLPIDFIVLSSSSSSSLSSSPNSNSPDAATAAAAAAAASTTTITNTTTAKTLLILYAIIFGFASGSNIALVPVCVGQLCATHEYGRYYATCYTITSFGTLAGIPIAGALLEICSRGGSRDGSRGGSSSASSASGSASIDDNNHNSTQEMRYYGLIAFTGACYAVSTAAFLGARVLRVGWGVRVFF